MMKWVIKGDDRYLVYLACDSFQRGERFRGFMVGQKYAHKFKSRSEAESELTQIDLTGLRVVRLFKKAKKP